MALTLISDFTGSDENPLSEGGNWANLNSAAGALQRVSNAVAGSAASQCRSYWTPANFGPDVEAYLTLTTTAVTTVGIDLRIQGEGGASTWDGYEVRITASSSPSTTIYRADNGATTGLIAANASGNWSAGDKLGLRCQGSTISAWRFASGGSSWDLVATATDATYPSTGKVGIEAGNTTVRVDDFYVSDPLEYLFGGGGTAPIFGR